MNVGELKRKIRELLGKQIVFNKEFTKFAPQLREQERNLLQWCSWLKDNNIKAYCAPKKKDSMVFIKKLGSTNRCIVIKMKNNEFKEVHLGDHKYYDYLRKQLGLKKDGI